MDQICKRVSTLANPRLAEKWPQKCFLSKYINYMRSWKLFCLKVKKVKESIAVNGTPSHSYGVSLAVWDHTVLPATRHKRTHPAFTPARQAGTRFTDHLRVEGWVSPGPRCKEQLAHCCYATARS